MTTRAAIPDPTSEQCNDRWPGEPAPSPAYIHHCDADQFIGFGNLVNRLLGEAERPTP